MQKSLYELTVITAPKKTEKDLKEMVEVVLAKVGARLVDFNFWGKKDVVYPIKKQATVTFGFFEVELEPEKAADMTSRLRMNDDIWRYLLIASEAKLTKTKAKKIINKKKPILK